MGSLTQCASLERLSVSRAFGHADHPYTSLTFGADRLLHFLVRICYKFKLTNTPAFDDWVYPAREYGKDIESNKYVVSEDCILVSKLNPQFKRIWKPISVSPNSVCSTEFMPFISTNPERIGYLYGVLNSDAFYRYMVQCSSSSTGSRKRMGPELCGDFKYATPTDSGDKVVQKFSDYAIEILKQQGQLREEIQRLIALREYLLPVVMTRRFLT